MSLPDVIADPLRQQLQGALGAAYTLGRELGGGGMSCIFLAREEALARDVVVKVLSPELAAALSAERFTREIRLAAALQEPHIVPVLAAGATAGGLPFYTMPFVRGASLRQRLQGGAVPLDEALGILRDVARALAYAHAQGVVHRDIKPENILLSSGTAVVTDFGIAKAVSASQVQPGGDATLTRMGGSLGTPAYMAPEQAAADPALDHRADLYAWGTVAYELLAGRHPFASHATPHALLVALFSEEPAPLGDVVPVLPAGVADVVMRCLAKDPARRPASADELLVALDTHGGGGAAPARRRVTAATFSLTDDVCRRLDRATLDARLLGGSLHYVENDAPADILLFCLPGIGCESDDYAALLRVSPHRVVAPTLFGFEPVVEHGRISLPLETHLGLLRELLRHAVTRLAPSRVIVVGFSCGADLAMRLVATAPDDAPPVDACLALSPNLSLATCFVSQIFARFHGGDSAALLADLKRIGADVADLDEWLNAMTYLLHVLRKFRGDVAPLSRFSAELVRPFAESEDTFATSFRAASERVEVMRCVFESSATCASLVRALRLRNLDTGVLGPRYDASSLVLESTEDHFALLDTARFLPQLDAVLASLHR